MHFDTWDIEIRSIRAELEQIQARAAEAPAQHLFRRTAEEKKKAEESKHQLSKDINAILNASHGSHSYLSEKSLGLLNWAKVFAEKSEKFCDSYITFLDRFLWARLLVYRLSGKIPKLLSYHRMPVYTQHLKDLCALKASLEGQVKHLKDIQERLRREYDFMRIADVNRTSLFEGSDASLALLELPLSLNHDSVL